MTYLAGLAILDADQVNMARGGESSEFVRLTPPQTPPHHEAADSPGLPPHLLWGSLGGLERRRMAYVSGEGERRDSGTRRSKKFPRRPGIAVRGRRANHRMEH